MAHRSVLITAVFTASVALCGATQAAQLGRNGKIYNYCTDNYGELVGACAMYPTDSGFYQMCVGNASSQVQYTCQNYRVPSNYGGTFFDNLDLDRYPKVGPASAPRPGSAPMDDKATLLGTIFNGLDPSTGATAPQ